MACTKSELNLFSEAPIQTSILRTTEVAYKPLNALPDDPSIIEFVSLGHGDSYRDLSSVYIRLQVRLMKNHKDESHILKKDNTSNSYSSVVNNILHSLFRQVSVYLNGVPIAQNNNDYGYRTYFETLLNYGRDATNTHLDSVGWALDTPGSMNDTGDDSVNAGYKTRKDRMKNSATVELMGRLHCDLFNQPRLLLNNVDLRVVMSIEKPEFYVMEKATAASYVKITSATLYMNHVTINPSLLLSYENALSRTPAIYPYRRVEVKAYTVPSNSYNISLDNIVIGQLPNLLLFAMVDNDAYTGTRNLNPFEFKHNNISRFNLLINGVQSPQEPIEFNYTDIDAPISTRGYQSLFKDTGIHYFDRGHQIDKAFFDGGCFILACDLTSDRAQEMGVCSNLLNQGTVRIEAQFRKVLPKTVTCLVYCEYDSIIKIDKNRNVFTKF